MKRYLVIIFVLALMALATVALADPGMTWEDILPGTLSHNHCVVGVATALPPVDNTIVVYCDTGPSKLSDGVSTNATHARR